MSAYAKINDSSVQEDALHLNSQEDALQLNSAPIDLNTTNLEEYEEEDESEDEYDNRLIASEKNDEEEPGTSGINESNDTDDDEEIIDLSAEMEPTTLNLFKLNIAYQEVITQYMSFIEQLLHHNKFKQMEREMEIGEDGERMTKPRSGGRIGMVIPPYFGDCYNPGQPNNPDKLLVHNLLGPHFERDPHFYGWVSSDEKKMKKAIKESALKTKILPLVSKLEYVLEKNVGNETEEPVAKKIKLIKEDIEEYKQKYKNSPHELYGDKGENIDWDHVANIVLQEKRTASDCKLNWTNRLCESVNKKKWTAEEDKKLINAVRKHNENNWVKIAADVDNGRKPIQCLRRYQQTLNKDFKSRPWTPDEDALLVSLIEKLSAGNHFPFSLIALKMKNRSKNQIHHRWNKTLDPVIKRTRWTAEEDVKLLQGVSAYQARWSVMRDKNVVPGRSDCQMRERFMNALFRNTNYIPWTKEEDILLLSLVESHGRKWAAISRKLGSRNDAQCLKRYDAIERSKKTGKPLTVGQFKPKFTLCDGIQRCREKLLQTICKDFKIDNGKLVMTTQEVDSNMKIKINFNQRRKPSKRKHWEILHPKILKEIDNHEDIAQTMHLYQQMLSHKANHPRRPANMSPAMQKAEAELIGEMTRLYQPLMQEAFREESNVNKLRTTVMHKCRNTTAKEIFVYYLTKLNIDAKLILDSIHESNNRGAVKMNELIKSKEAPSIEVTTETQELMNKSTFQRKLYLDLCAPNRSSVRAFKVISTQRDTRKNKAKTIICDNEAENDKANGKYTVKEILKPIQMTAEYKVFRSRFMSLFTWPAVLASTIPAARGADGGLRPVMGMKKIFLDQMYIKSPAEFFANNL